MRNNETIRMLTAAADGMMDEALRTSADLTPTDEMSVLLAAYPLLLGMDDEVDEVIRLAIRERIVTKLHIAYWNETYLESQAANDCDMYAA